MNIIKTQNKNNISYNVPQIYLGFLFNIYIKIINEYERQRTHTKFQRTSRKLEYI